jgi:hypothetical protein
MVTSCRFPFALELVRKLGARGEEVVAADSYAAAPAMQSRERAESVVLGGANVDPPAYADQVAAVARDRDVDLLVPAYEEVFFLARNRRRLEEVELFAASFDALAQLHDKVSFVALCERLGLPTPATRVARGDDELAEAIAATPRYLARPAYSRGGVYLLTNAGPRAGRLPARDCHPTPAWPWLVQEYVEAEDVCSFSVARDGRVLAHLEYEIPAKLDDSYGIQFVSADPTESLPLVQRIVAELGYTGQISFDYKRGKSGLLMIECNPRATHGLALAPDDLLDKAICHPGEVDAPLLVEPGRKMQFDLGIVKDVLGRKLPVLRGLRDLLTVRDLYLDKHDIVPALYGLALVRHDMAARHLAQDKHAEIAEALTDDVMWNGEPIPT